mgnify:FL=1
MKANKKSKAELKKLLAEEPFKRTTLSFYRYVILPEPEKTRDFLYEAWEALGVLGRIYVAREGINAQLSVPEHNFQAFKDHLFQQEAFRNVPLKIAVEDNGKSFYKLIVRVRKKIVADGLPDDAFDVTNVGTHLTALEFNQALEAPETVVVDMRNHYESEVGRFEGALCPDADTFRDELSMVKDLLQGKEENKILLYCTGGIRCEKASAWLRHHGFKDVNQLYGGIIQYAREVKATGLPSKFIGKNFVFDERMGERITNDVIASCHQCGSPSDHHTNCANDDCHLLFIQCPACGEKMEVCCSDACQNIIHLPLEEQKKLRRGKQKHHAHSVYKSRLRPKLRGNSLM